VAASPSERPTRLVTAPEPDPPIGPPPPNRILEVRLGEHQDVEWSWSQTPSGRTYVSGYTIIDRVRMRPVAVIGGVIGFLYGCILSYVSFHAAGIGHGCYVITGLVSSPVSLFNSIPLAWFATPFLWSAVGFLLGRLDDVLKRRWFIGIMIAHYLALTWVLRDGHGYYNHFCDWSYLPKVRDRVMTGFAIYAVGQAAVWSTFIVSRKRSGRSDDA
jgi:hypothetical protein